MRRTGTSVLLAAVSSLSIAWAPPALSGEIRGRLLLDSKPAPGIAVQAVPAESPMGEARREARRQGPPAPISSVVSGTDGNFALSLPATPSKEFRIRLEGGGIVTALIPGTFDTQETEDLGDLVAVKGGRLAGRLEKADGTPLAGAEVLLAPSRGIGSGLESGLQAVKSGPDGSFRFEAAHPDRNELSVRADGSWFQPLSGIRAGTIAAPLVARPGGALAGLVRQSDRKTPVPGALVRFEGQARSRWVETGADGTFLLTDVPAGTGLLLADGGDSGFAEILGARASATLVTATLAPGARLEGRVVDTVTGKAVPRAKVSALGSRGLVSTRSGADGRYLLRNMLPGRLSVRGDEPRYAPWERSGVVLRAGEIRKLDLPLTPGVSISGTVVDENGVPVAGAKGSLGPAAQAGIRALMAGVTGPTETSFVSAPNGSFRATRLRAGDNQRLTVQHPGHETGTLSGLNLPPGTVRAGLKVVLQQGLALTGFVRDGKQAGIAGAELTLSQSRSFGGPRSGMVFNFGAPLPGRPESEKTSGDGSFTFRGLPPGDYQLQVKRSGYATESMGPIKLARGEAPRPVEVVLGPGAAIAGTVKLKDGRPQAGRIVVARSPGGGGGLALGGGQQPTGPDGLFVLDGLKPGEPYDLLLVEPAALPRVARSGVTAPADGIDLLLPTPGRITGIAVDAASGKPVVDFQVWYDPDRSTGQGGGGQMIRVVARGAARQAGIAAGEKVVVHAEDGGFALENVPAGNWEVNVEAQGYQAARVGGVSVAEGSERSGVSVKLSPGVTLVGKVVDTMSGRGVPNAQVQTSGAGAQGGPGAALRLALPQGDDTGPTTDADGAFQIDGMAPGKYSVSVRHPDYADGSESVELKETGGSVRVPLSAGSHIAGIVADAGNRPLPGAQVSLVAASDSGPMGRGALPSSGTTTDQGGSFRFDHLAAGRYTVTASLRNASSAQQQVALAAGQSQDGLVISISAGATVRGTVTGLAAEKRGNVLVAASGADGFGSSVRTGADGSFEVSGVPEGILMLRATAGDLLTSSRTKSTEVQVPAGQALVSAEIAFDPSGSTVSGSVTRGGQPVSGGAVMVNARGGAGINASGAVDESGRYRVEGVQNGTYNVTYLDTASGGAGTSRQVTVAADVTVDLDVPQGRITGIVVEAGSGLPLADVMVTASPTSGSTTAGGGPGGGGARTASSDSNGEFSLETLNPATFNVTARRSGYLFDPKSVTLSGPDTQDVTLQGRRSEGIGVQASDGLLGVPLRSLQARVRSATGNVFVGGISLDGNGRGEIPSVQAGSYSVILDANGYAPAVLAPVNVPSQTLVVALTPGGNVEIRAGEKTLATGTAQATLRTAGGVAYPFSVFGQEGRIVLNFPVRTIQNIAPGQYNLALDSGGSKSFSVLEGQTAVVTLP